MSLSALYVYLRGQEDALTSCGKNTEKYSLVVICHQWRNYGKRGEVSASGRQAAGGGP